MRISAIWRSGDGEAAVVRDLGGGVLSLEGYFCKFLDLPSLAAVAEDEKGGQK